MSLVAVGVIVGCAPPKPATKGPAKPVAASKPNLIDVTAGDATTIGKNNERIWRVYWTTARVSVPGGAQQINTGSMNGVHGQIFRKDSVVCSFKSDHGWADNTDKVLTLTDHVRIESQKPPILLLCDKVVYDGNRKFFRAVGHVHVLGTMGTVGTLDELWATPDLNRIASPGLFKQP